MFSSAARLLWQAFGGGNAVQKRKNEPSTATASAPASAPFAAVQQSDESRAVAAAVIEAIRGVEKSRELTVFMMDSSGGIGTEWAAVLSLREAGFDVREAVVLGRPIYGFSAKDDAYCARMGAQLGIATEVVHSHLELMDLVLSRCGDPREVVVMYAGINFAARSLTEGDVAREQAAAVRFWRWCATRACNPPRFFVSDYELHGCPGRLMARCETWTQLADAFERRSTAAEDALLSVLRPSACFPENAASAAAHALGEARAAGWDRHARLTVFFLGSGSGFHEWRILIALLAAGIDIATVVFMDAVCPAKWGGECVGAWEQLARGRGVELRVRRSFPELEDDCVKLSAAKTTEKRSLVLYVNAGIKFGRYFCDDPDACERAALRFWSWCAANAINPPLNFMEGGLFKMTDAWPVEETSF